MSESEKTGRYAVDSSTLTPKEIDQIRDDRESLRVKMASISAIVARAMARKMPEGEVWEEIYKISREAADFGR